MSESRIDAFLAGERIDDIAIYLPSETIDDAETLLDSDVAEPAASGIYIVVDGERGRSMFEQVIGTEVMTFASTAMGTPGTIGADLSAGECPNAVEGPQDHSVRFVFAFAEAKNDEVGGLYAEGDVIHAYAQCTCGEQYSDTWIAEPEE